MKVFISWSGDLSHKVALSIRDWLPSVIQNIEPYVSSEDIDKGARWSTDIAKELEESFYGILCVTKDNLNSQWLNFEAGALSKTIDKSKVSPFLFGVKRSEVQGPILQFQSTIYEKEDVLKLLHSINSSNDPKFLEEARLESTFDVWWPRLQTNLDLIESKIEDYTTYNSETNTVGANEILEEILELLRNQQRLLNSPEDLIPKHYLSSAMGKEIMPEGVVEELVVSFSDLIEFIESNKEDVENSVLQNLNILALSLARSIRAIANKHGINKSALYRLRRIK